MKNAKCLTWLVLFFFGLSLGQDAAYAFEVVPGASNGSQIPQSYGVVDDSEWYSTNEDARSADPNPTTFDPSGNGNVYDAQGRLVKIVHGRGTGGWTLIGYYIGNEHQVLIQGLRSGRQDLSGVSVSSERSGHDRGQGSPQRDRGR